MSQLTELLVLLAHERDAAVLQAAMDAAIKQWLSACEAIVAQPPPPANPSAKAREEAAAALAGLAHKQRDLLRTTWKWDLLRP